MAASNPNLEKAEMLILIESSEFKEIKRQFAQILETYRSEENNHSFSAHYVLDFYSDGSGSIACGDQDYYYGKYIVEYPPIKQMFKYLGKTFTILNPEVVYDVISINELEGYSEILLPKRLAPATAYEYVLKDSTNWRHWVIRDEHIDELLEQGAITIT